MPKLTIDEVQFLTFKEDIAVKYRHLPHWTQAGTLSFITWRTADSMPKEVVEQWVKQRASWLRIHGLDPTQAHWRRRLRTLSRDEQLDYHRRFTNRWLELLGDCHGDCLLRQRALAEVVGTSLRHFDGQRYLLTDYVVMPNHVHVLAAFPNEEGMLAQCESWKHYTATQINRATGRDGRFWQSDDFDHLVRSEEQFHYFRRYIADNLIAVGLEPSNVYHFSKQLAT
jgi:type I restriction enzyme R subunit